MKPFFKIGCSFFIVFISLLQTATGQNNVALFERWLPPIPKGITFVKIYTRNPTPYDSMQLALVSSKQFDQHGNLLLIVKYQHAIVSSLSGYQYNTFHHVTKEFNYYYGYDSLFEATYAYTFKNGKIDTQFASYYNTVVTYAYDKKNRIKAQNISNTKVEIRLFGPNKQYYLFDYIGGIRKEYLYNKNNLIKYCEYHHQNATLPDYEEVYNYRFNRLNQWYTINNYPEDDTLSFHYKNKLLHKITGTKYTVEITYNQQKLPDTIILTFNYAVKPKIEYYRYIYQ